ncbi:MAG: hypothetical protein AAB656_04080 [Patescibacteria group bacterium]
MRKYFLFLISLLFLLNLVSPVNANATGNCYPVQLVVGCGSDISCGGLAPGYCCPTQSGCEGQAEQIGPRKSDTEFGGQLNTLMRNIPGFKFGFFGTSNLGYIITIALRYVFTIAGILLLIFLILSGFKLFTSGGDQKKVAEAKTSLTNALIGFVVVFIAFWIVQIGGSIFGLENSAFQGLFK